MDGPRIVIDGDYFTSIPLSTFPNTCWDLRVLSTLSYWFSMTNKIKGLRPPPKISSCFGPIIIVIPTIFVQYKLVPKLYIMPASCLNQHNQHPNICWEILIQSKSAYLKLKFETVWNRDFHWLFWHPGVGVFLLFGEKRKTHQCASWPTRRFKCLLCDIERTIKCLCALNIAEKYFTFVLYLFFVLFAWV